MITLQDKLNALRTTGTVWDQPDRAVLVPKSLDGQPNLVMSSQVGIAPYPEDSPYYTPPPSYTPPGVGMSLNPAGTSKAPVKPTVPYGMSLAPTTSTAPKTYPYPGDTPIVIPKGLPGYVDSSTLSSNAAGAPGSSVYNQQVGGAHNTYEWNPDMATGDGSGSGQDTPISSYVPSALLAQAYKASQADTAAAKAQALKARNDTEAVIAKSYNEATTKEEKASLKNQLAMVRRDYDRVIATINENAKFAAEAAVYYSGQTSDAYNASRDAVVAQSQQPDTFMTDRRGLGAGVAQVNVNTSASDNAAAANMLNEQGASWAGLGNTLAQAAENARMRGGNEASLSAADANNMVRIAWNDRVGTRKTEDRRRAGDARIANINNYGATMQNILNNQTGNRNAYATAETQRQDNADNRDSNLMLESVKAGAAAGPDAAASSDKTWDVVMSAVPDNVAVLERNIPATKEGELDKNIYIDTRSMLYDAVYQVYMSPKTVSAVWTSMVSGPDAVYKIEALKAAGITGPKDLTRLARKVK